MFPGGMIGHYYYYYVRSKKHQITKYMFRYFLQILSETLLVLTRIHRDTIINVHKHSDKPFNIKIGIIRKRLAMIGINKTVGPDGIPGAIVKMGGDAMIPYLARLLDITINNGTIPRDCAR
jgi:hypothetical protein